jgi:ElaB/YqjD/DUF883 family membrane-anchored ribosome-binding protein
MAKDRTRAEELADNARELAEEARDRAEEAFQHAQSAVEDGFDEAHRYLKRQWRERPVAVAASALGAGVIIGLLIGRRR